MAKAKINNHIANSTITLNGFSQRGGTSAYQGYFILTANNGYYFPDVSDTAVDVTANTQYKVTYGNRNYSVGLSYVSETRDSNGNCIAIRFSSRGYEVSESIFENTWNLSGLIKSLVEPTEITVIQNLQNCTISGLPSTVTDKSNLQLTLTAASGYTFEQTPVLTFKELVLDNNGNAIQNLNFVVTNDKLTATLSVDLSTYDLNYINLCDTITITATAESNIKIVPITTNLNNCTTNAPTNITGNMTTVNINCTANENYEFNTAPTIIFYDSNNVALHSFTFNVLSSKSSANVTFDVSQFNDFENVESIVLTATAAAVVHVVDVQTNIQNAVLNGLPSDVYADSVLNLTVTANNGYKFDTVPNVYILDGDGNPNIAYFTLATDKLSGTITLDLGNYIDMQSGHVTITANAAAITPYVDKYGTINVYKVTTQNLSDFAALRFIKEKENPSDTSGYFQLIDLGDYVVSVKRFYCPIIDVLTAYIKAGNYNTNIQAETPQNDNFVIDCGTVTIPNKNNSITDYQTDIKIFLPFVGFVSVPSDYVGKTLTLKYKVNIITGDSLALLTCNGIEVDFIQCTVSNDIIFKTNKENVFGGNAEFNLQVLKGLQPYAVIKYFTDENKQIYNADCKRVLLSEINGYFVVSELTNFTANITETENQMLVNELANGVIILGF